MDVINIDTGCLVGYVSDVEINTTKGCVDSFIVEKTQTKLFSKRSTVKICWKDIVVIGKEAVLIRNVTGMDCKKQ